MTSIISRDFQTPLRPRPPFSNISNMTCPLRPNPSPTYGGPHLWTARNESLSQCNFQFKRITSLILNSPPNPPNPPMTPGRFVFLAIGLII